MSALVVTFLSHLEVPNAASLAFSSLERGTAVVQQLMLEQLQDAENDMHILKASQISVNSAVRTTSNVTGHLKAVHTLITRYTASDTNLDSPQRSSQLD